MDYLDMDEEKERYLELESKAKPKRKKRVSSHKDTVKKQKMTRNKKEWLNFKRNKALKISTFAFVIVFSIGLLNTVFWGGKAQIVNMSKQSEHNYVSHILSVDESLVAENKHLKNITKDFESGEVSSASLQDEYRASCNRLQSIAMSLVDMEENSEVPETFLRGANFHGLFTDVVKLRWQCGDAVLNYFAGGDETNLDVADSTLKEFEEAHDKTMSLFYQIVSENKL